MRYQTGAAATAIYQCRKDLRLVRYRVWHEPLRRFCREVSQLEAGLGDARHDDYWGPFLDWLRRLRFHWLAIPLRAGHPAIYEPEQAAGFQRHLASCSQVYPGFAGSAQRLLERVEELVACPCEPLMDVVLELQLRTKRRTALVIARSRAMRAVEERLQECGLTAIEVVNPRQLPRSGCYERLVVLGAAGWFDESVYTAPRAAEICTVHYGWVNGKFTLEPVFVFPVAPVVAVPEEVIERASERLLAAPDHEPVEPSMLLLPAMGGATERPAADDAADDVDACLFYLEGEKGVYLQSGASCLIIDLDDGRGVPVVRRPVTEVEPGHFLLLRTGGGGDYLVPVADSILGELANRARAAQREWKHRLRERLHGVGLQQVLLELERAGCTRATGLNVRNWTSQRTICPNYREDFDAIMRLVGLSELADEYWQLMRTVDRAHTRAGQQIRKQLLRQVRESDLRTLERYGRLEFTLRESASVSLTAFRVEQILGERRVAASHVAQPFELEGYPWPG